MEQQNSNSSPRRSIANLSILGTSLLHLRNPYVIAFWSIAFPGMGHLLLSKYIRGFLLFIWEIVINYNSHINLLIFYSFLGDFEKAKSVVDIKWMTLYIPTYIFAIWDSYRTTIHINNNYILAAREDAEIKSFIISPLELNYLDKRSPLTAFSWSLLIPGSGQLYTHKIINAFFIMMWWIVSVYCSNLLPVFHYSLLGNFNKATALINMHWFLNIPSLYLFAAYDAYVHTVEVNKLFDWEQSKFLKKNYQHKAFQIPSKKNAKGDKMYIVSTFEHTEYLELAITAIQVKGIAKENILAVPMDMKDEERKLFDSLHSSDGLSLFDLAAILATLFGIFGSIYGFVLKWGPLFWGLIGIFLGFLLGFTIKLVITKRYNNRKSNLNNAGVVLIIECAESEVKMVKDTLWSHFALGVSDLKF